MTADGDSSEERPIPDNWTAETLHANDIEVASYRTGDRGAPTVVVAHGFYEDARCLQPLVDALAEDYDVVAYDARGHGHTDAPEEGYALADRVADLLGVLDALDLDDPILYGHSMGGGTVAGTAAEHDDRIGGVVMEDPSSMRGPPDEDLEEMAAFVAEQIEVARSKSLDELAAEYVEAHPDVVEAHPGQAEAGARADHCLSPNLAQQARELPALLDELFPDIGVPALVVRRDVDVDERVRDREIADALPQGRLVHVPESAHHVVLSRPDAALREVRAFLQRTTGHPPLTDDEPAPGDAEDEGSGVNDAGEGDEDEEGLSPGDLDVTYRDDGRPERLDDDREVPDGWEAGTVEANGVAVAYSRAGDREDPTMLLVHGFSSDARSMSELVSELEADHDVVAYDARGHGYSDAPADGYAVADRADDLAGVVDALDLDDPILYGHSMGGSTVGVAAAEYPERVGAVVMEEPGGIHGPPMGLDPAEFVELVREETEAAHANPVDDLAAQTVEDFPALFGDRPELATWSARAYHRTSTHAAQAVGGEAGVLADRFPDIEVPALWLTGDWEFEAHVHDLGLAEDFPDGRLVSVPEAGHNVVLSQPEAAFAELRTFLREVESDDGD